MYRKVASTNTSHLEPPPWHLHIAYGEEIGHLCTVTNCDLLRKK
jgi:hypothetical protein